MGRYVFGALLLVLATLAHGQRGFSLEERVDRLERLQGQGAADLLLQLQQLQREVQQLRGELEVQRYELESLMRSRGGPSLEARPPVVSPPPGAPPAPVPGPESGMGPDIDQGQDLAEEPPPATPTPTMPAGPPVTRRPPADASGGQDAYQRGFDLLRRGNYAEASSAFQTYLEQAPDGPQADNAQYWLGETRYVNRDFDAALRDFNQVLERYPRSAKVPGALLKIGYIHYEGERWAEARQTLGQLQERYPNTTEARLAQQRLERMKKEGR